ADRDGAMNAVAHNPGHYLADVGMPVAHRDVGAESRLLSVLIQTPFQRSGLPSRNLEQGRTTANQRVAAANLGDELGRRWPAAANVQDVGLDVVQAVRTTVREQQDRAFPGSTHRCSLLVLGADWHAAGEPQDRSRRLFPLANAIRHANAMI